MRSLLLKISRGVFGWPPQPAPTAVKEALVGKFAAQVGNLIETGTFEGDMIEAQRERYARLVTIEKDSHLFAAAEKRFAPFPHVTVLNGDSGDELPKALKLCEGAIVFWLDAHYSGGVTAGGGTDAPILKELAFIADRRNPGDVILIDDARLFGWERGYPRLSRIRQFAQERLPRHEFRVDTDIICIVPAASAGN